MPSQSKFGGIDFSQLPVERLTPEFLNLEQGFRCVRGEFVTDWKQGRIAREAEIVPVVGVRFVTVNALYDRDTEPAMMLGNFIES